MSAGKPAAPAASDMPSDAEPEPFDNRQPLLYAGPQGDDGAMRKKTDATGRRGIIRAQPSQHGELSNSSHAEADRATWNYRGPDSSRRHSRVCWRSARTHE